MTTEPMHYCAAVPALSAPPWQALCGKDRWRLDQSRLALTRDPEQVTCPGCIKWLAFDVESQLCLALGLDFVEAPWGID